MFRNTRERASVQELHVFLQKNQIPSLARQATCLSTLLLDTAFVKSIMHSKQKVFSLCRELGDTTLMFSVETQATKYVQSLSLTSAHF